MLSQLTLTKGNFYNRSHIASDFKCFFQTTQETVLSPFRNESFNHLIAFFSVSLKERYRSNHPEVFLGKGVLKTCSKFAGEHQCQSAILIKLLCNFIEITLRHGCSPVNLLHIFRTPFLKNTYKWLLQTFYVVRY